VTQRTGNIINAVIDNDVDPVRLVLVLGDLGLGELLGHFGGLCLVFGVVSG